MKQHSYNKGFSITGVLVASVLIGLLSVVLSSLLTSSNKGRAQIQAKTSFNSLMNNLNFLFSKPDLCANAFSSTVSTNTPATFDGSETDLGGIYAASSRMIEKGQILDGVKVERLYLKPISGTGPDYVVQLIVEGQTSEGLGGKSLSNSDSAPLIGITVDISNRIVSCSSPIAPGGLGGMCNGGNSIGAFPPSDCNRHMDPATSGYVGFTGQGGTPTCFWAYGNFLDKSAGVCPPGFTLYPSTPQVDWDNCSNHPSPSNCAGVPGTPVGAPGMVPSLSAGPGNIYCEFWTGGMCIKD